MIPMMIRIAIAKAAPIQRGERTQSQDQVIIPQSLRTMKTIVKRPVKPMPPDDAVAVAELLIVLMFYLIMYFVY